MDRRAARYRKQQLRRKVILMLVIVIAVAIAFGVLWSGALSRGVLKPGKVGGVKADAVYAGITLSWEEARRADGYVIYENQGGTYVKAGQTEGRDACEYMVKDAARDETHEYCVAAYNYSRMSNKNFEGEPSEEISAIYDSSQYAQKIPVLAYHQIMPAGHTSDSGLLIAEDKLEEQLKYLSDNGFKTLTLDEFYQWYKGKKEFPVKTVVFTFDDGFDAVYWLGYPLFKKYDMAATVFCIGKNTAGVTDSFEGRNDDKNHYIRMDVIEKTRKEYPKFAFESHTYDMHSRIDGVKPAKAFTYEQDMEDCRKNEQFGFRYLAYPWGTYTETFQKAVKDSGYKMAFAYRPYYYATRDDDQYAVNRIKISGKMKMENFIKTVNLEKEDYNNPDL